MKKILITGASSGLGLGMVKSLASNGHRVYAGVLNASEKEQFPILDNVTPLILDVTNNDDIVALKEQLADGLDVLINNAGIGIGGPLLEVTPDEMFTQFNVNVFGSIKIIQTVIDLLMESKGHIISVSSINGHVPSPFTPLYAMSKYAIEAMNEAMRIELASFDIRVTTLNPGLYHTQMLYKLKEEMALRGRNTKYYEEFYKKMEEFDPTGLGKDVEILGNDVVKIVEAEDPPTRFISGSEEEKKEAYNMIIKRLEDLMSPDFILKDYIETSENQTNTNVE